MDPSKSDILGDLIGDFERTGEREIEREREREGEREREWERVIRLRSASKDSFLRGDLDLDLDLPLLSSELKRSRRGIGPFLAHSIYMLSPRNRLP